MIVYFDTSAFVKMFLPDEPALLAHLAWDMAPTTAVSLLLLPEARSAIARARRYGRRVSLAPDETQAEIDERMESSHAVTPTYRLLHEAGDLAEVRGLRGFDAVHLASALNDAHALHQAGTMRALCSIESRFAILNSPLAGCDKFRFGHGGYPTREATATLHDLYEAPLRGIVRACLDVQDVGGRGRSLHCRCTSAVRTKVHCAGGSQRVTIMTGPNSRRASRPKGCGGGRARRGHD